MNMNQFAISKEFKWFRSFDIVFLFFFFAFISLNSKMKYTPSLWTLIAYFQRPLTIKVAQYFSILHFDILLWLWFYVYSFHFLFYFFDYCMLFNYVHDACTKTLGIITISIFIQFKTNNQHLLFHKKKKIGFFFHFGDTCNNWICLGHSCAYIHRTVLEILLHIPIFIHLFFCSIYSLYIVSSHSSIYLFILK